MAPKKLVPPVQKYPRGKQAKKAQLFTVKLTREQTISVLGLILDGAIANRHMMQSEGNRPSEIAMTLAEYSMVFDLMAEGVGLKGAFPAMLKDRGDKYRKAGLLS